MYKPLDYFGKRGLLTVPQMFSIFLSLLIRAVTIGIALYALIMVNSDIAVKTVTHPFVNAIDIFYAYIPVGRLVMGVTYSSVGALLPIQIIGALIGYLSILCKNKIGMIVHFVMSMVSISLMTVYFVLIGGVLYHLHGNIYDQFVYELQSGADAGDFQNKSECCGMSIDSEDCSSHPYKAQGCWDLWSSSMATFCSTLIAMYALNVFLELVYVAITEYEYVSLRKKEAKGHKEDNIYWHQGLAVVPRDIVGDLVRYIHCFMKSESWKTIIVALVRLSCGVIAVALIIYASVNMVLYPSFSQREMMEAIRIFGIYYDQLIYALCISLIVICSITLTAVVLAYVASMTSSVALYCASAGVGLVGVVLKLGFITSWIVMAATFYNNLDGCIDLFKTYPDYYSWWNSTKSEFGCCVGDCSTTDTVVGIIHFNFEVRNLTQTQNWVNRSGIYAYLKSKFIQRNGHLKAFKVSTFIFSGVLSLFSLGLVLFGVAVMHDYMFTDREVEDIFLNIHFYARTFSTTMRYLGVGLCVIGLIDISLNIAEVMSLCFTTVLYRLIISVLRVIFILCLIVMVSVWTQTHEEIASNITDRLKNYYFRTVTSFSYIDPRSQAETSLTDLAIFSLQYSCCGIASIADNYVTGWYNSYNPAVLPIYCCHNPEFGYHHVCESYYNEGCGGKITERFDWYSNRVRVMIGFYIFIQIIHAALSVDMLCMARYWKSVKSTEERCYGCCARFVDDAIELVPKSASRGRRHSVVTERSNQVVPIDE